MIKALSLLMFFGLLFIPLSHGMMWQSTETHTLYSSNSWMNVSAKMTDAHVSVGLGSWAMWNASSIYIPSTKKWVNISGISKVWVGGDYVGIKHENGSAELVNLDSGKAVNIPIKNVEDMVLTDFGALIFNSSLFLFNMTSSKITELSNLSFRDADAYHHEFIFSRNSTVFVFQGDKEIWNQSLDSKVEYAYGFAGGYYILTEDMLYYFNNHFKEAGKMKVNDKQLTVLNENPVLMSEIVDDEGKRQWSFNVLTFNNGSFEHHIQYLAYLPPQDVSVLGKFVAFYTSERIHILSDAYHVYTNNTFTKVYFSSNTIVGINSTGVYFLTSENIENSMKYIGEDHDMDWIPDSIDSDKDNDGMPNWWEEKYGLNPLNPADRNQDPDCDGLTNYQEYLNGTNPLNWDTDGDGLSDGYEVAHGMNPLVPNHSEKYNISLINYTILTFFALFAILGIKKEKN